MAIGDNLEPGMGGGGTQDEIWRMRDQDGNIVLVNVSLLGGLQAALRRFPHLAPVSRQANQATVGQLGPGMVAADPFSQANGGGMGGNGGGGSGGGGVTPPGSEVPALAGTTLFPAQAEGIGVPGGSDRIGAPLSEVSREGEFATFLRNLGQRGFEEGLPRTIAQRRFNPAQSAFEAENLLAGARLDPVQGEFTPGTFVQFLGGLGPDLGEIGGRVRGAFGSLADLARRSTLEGPVQPGALGPGGLTDFQRVAGQRLARPDLATSEGQDLANQLSNLGRQSALSRFSPIVGNRLFGGTQFDPDRLQSQFLAREGTAGAPTANFVNFLSERFGLPSGAF